MTRTMSRRHVLTGLGMVGLGGLARAAVAQDPVTPPGRGPVLTPPLDGTWARLRGLFARLSVVHHEYEQYPNTPAGIAIPPFATAEIIGPEHVVLACVAVPPLGPTSMEA